MAKNKHSRKTIFKRVIAMMLSGLILAPSYAVYANPRTVEQIEEDHDSLEEYTLIQVTRYNHTYSIAKYLEKNLSPDDWGSMTYGEGWICIGVPSRDKMDIINDKYQKYYQDKGGATYSFTEQVTLVYLDCQYTRSDLKKIEKSIRASGIYKRYQSKDFEIYVNSNGYIKIETDKRYADIEKWLETYKYKDIIWYGSKDVKIPPE